MTDEVKDRNLVAVLDSIQGKYNKEKLVNWDIDLKNYKPKDLYGTTLWVQKLDDPSAHLVQKGLLALPTSSIKGPASICKVLMCGPKTEHAKENEIVLVPQGAFHTSAMRVVEGYNTYFIKEEFVLCVLQYEGTIEDVKKDIEENILLKHE